MRDERSNQIIDAVGKIIIGKEKIIEQILMTIYAGGHILLEDCPGVGKTTLAIAFARVLGLEYNRLQFTPDTMPSDITGFSVYVKDNGGFEYRTGALDCQLFLGDEINRTSPKTQAALLEVMEENQVTVDGIVHKMKSPFICIATQNPTGAAGTNALPESQLDRFMVKLRIGYPTTEEQMLIMKQRQNKNPLDEATPIITAKEIQLIKGQVKLVRTVDSILRYIALLCEATRESPMVELGVSPRGVIALSQLSRAKAYLAGRKYVIPEDVQDVYIESCAHRIVLKPQARAEGTKQEKILKEILETVRAPRPGKM